MGERKPAWLLGFSLPVPCVPCVVGVERNFFITKQTKKVFSLQKESDDIPSMTFQVSDIHTPRNRNVLSAELEVHMGHMGRFSANPYEC